MIKSLKNIQVDPRDLLYLFESFHMQWIPKKDDMVQHWKKRAPHLSWCIFH